MWATYGLNVNYTYGSQVGVSTGAMVASPMLAHTWPNTGRVDIYGAYMPICGQTYSLLSTSDIICM